MTNQRAIETLRALRDHYRTVAAFYVGTKYPHKGDLRANVAALEYAITSLEIPPRKERLR